MDKAISLAIDVINELRNFFDDCLVEINIDLKYESFIDICLKWYKDDHLCQYSHKINRGEFISRSYHLLYEHHLHSIANKIIEYKGEIK